jgi:hypothetical protein
MRAQPRCPPLLAAGLLFGASGLLGAWVWLLDSRIETLALLALVPALACLLPSRVQVTAWFAGYFLSSLLPVASAVADYFGDAWLAGQLAWLALALLWTAIWSLSWAPRGAGALRRVIGLLLALVLGLVPPLGALGFATPLLGAGGVLPGLGFAALAVLVLAWCALAARPTWTVASLTGACLVSGALWTHEAGRTDRVLPDAVRALQTRVAPPADIEGLALQVGHLAQAARRNAGPGVSMLVYPESAMQTWRPGSARLVQSLLLPHSWHTSLLLGTTLDVQRADRSNVALVLSHGQIRVVQQRQPLVLGLWAPWRPDHVRANWLAPAVLDIGGLPVAIRLCGDELLLGLALIDFWSQSPRLIVAMANHGWSRHPVHDRVQARHTEAMARLFGVPHVRAVNRFSTADSTP